MTKPAKIGLIAIGIAGALATGDMPIGGKTTQSTGVLLGNPALNDPHYRDLMRISSEHRLLRKKH